ncbi:hypothetical protein FQZ97_1059600 [compost metagenome]
MLQLFVGEAHDGFQRGLVAEPVVAAYLQHLRADEALDQAEHVGVGAALHLAQESVLGRAQEGQFVGQRQTVGQEGVGQVECSAAYHVAVDVPADAFGDFDGLGVAWDVQGGGWGLHGVSSRGWIRLVDVIEESTGARAGA